MTEFKHDANDLEQRLRDYYQRRYEQPPNPALIWARVQPQLDCQEHSQSGLLHQAKWLPGFIGHLAVRQQAALKERYKEHTFMDEKIHEEAILIDQTSAHDPRFTKNTPPLRRRVQHLVEAGIAAVLVAGLLLGWFAITRLHSDQAQPMPLFTYTSQPGETMENGVSWTPDKRYITFMACNHIPLHESCRYLAWNVATGKVKQTFALSEGNGMGSVRSSDGRYAFVVTWDLTTNIGTARLINILTGQVKQIYQGGHYQPFVWAAFSHDSKSLAFIDGRDIQVWDVATGKLRLTSDPIFVPGGEQAMGTINLQVNWSGDDKRIGLGVYPASGSNGLQVWDARTGHRLATIVEMPGMALSSLSPDMRYVLTYDPQKEMFAVRDTDTLKILQSFPGQLNPPDAGVLPAWVDSGARLLLRQNQQAIIWNTTTGQQVASCPLTNVQGLESPASAITGSEEGHYTACLQQDNQLTILDSLTGSTVNTFPLKIHPRFFSWWNSSKYLFVQDKDTRFGGQVYNALSGQPALSYTGTVSLSPDGTSLAVISMPADGRFGPKTTTTIQVFALH